MSQALQATDRSAKSGRDRPSLWVELLGAEVRFYDANGIRTRALEAGDGPALIFLHGVGGHAEAFAPNISPLSSEFRTIAIDYLGFGLTDKPAQPVGRDEYVRHLIDFMDAAGIDKAHLAGESLGGWIAMWTALLHPERVDKLISICGARMAVETDPESQRHVEHGRGELRRLTNQFSDDPTRENVRKRMEWLFYDPDRDLTEELVDLRWALYQQPEMRRSLRASSQRMIENHDSAVDLSPDDLGSIEHETLMLWTSHNPSTTAATAERASAYLPNCTFTVMQRCGHWPQWEDPATFNDIVAGFLKGSADE